MEYRDEKSCDSSDNSDHRYYSTDSKSSCDSDKTTKTVWMFFYGVVLMAVGYAWDFWFPINKSLWTSSYVVYTGGLALIFLAFCYWLIDVQNKTWWIKPFHIYGTNAIAVFFLSSLTAKGLYLIKVTGANGDSISLKY